jgi:hypothetical protein
VAGESDGPCQPLLGNAFPPRNVRDGPNGRLRIRANRKLDRAKRPAYHLPETGRVRFAT